MARSTITRMFIRRVAAAAAVSGLAVGLVSCSTPEAPTAAAPANEVTASAAAEEAPAPETAALVEEAAPAPAEEAAPDLGPVEEEILPVESPTIENTAAGPLAEWGTFILEGPAPVQAQYGPMQFALPLNPSGEQTSSVRWVAGLGVSPNDAAWGTTYVLGHAWAQQRLVFNGFSELATNSIDWNAPQAVPARSGGNVVRFNTGVLNGSRVTMVDGEGDARVWQIDNTFLIDKNQAIEDADLMNVNIKGRIVLIACAVAGGRDLNYNVVMMGHLV
ncbi:MAG: sortase [Corynebacterium sp.]|nr:sortase [Corynebacterium sp.]